MSMIGSTKIGFYVYFILGLAFGSQSSRGRLRGRVNLPPPERAEDKAMSDSEKDAKRELNSMEKEFTSLGAVSLVPSTSRRTGSNLGSSGRTSAPGRSKIEEVPAPRQVQPDVVRIEQLRITCRDGRKCILCSLIMNTAKDPLLDELVYWAYPPRNYGKGGKDDWRVEGSIDWYCEKVFRNIYRAKFKTADNLKIEFGTNPDLLQEFQSWRLLVVEKIVAAGARNITIRWSSDALKKELIHINSTRVIIEEPNDMFVHVEHYEWGCPETNGLGHRRAAHPVTGRPAICFAESNVTRVKRQKVQALETRTEAMGKDDDCLYDGQYESTMKDLELELIGERAVGRSLSEINKHAQISTSPVSPLAMASPPTALPSGAPSTSVPGTHDSNGFGFSLGSPPH
jgi:hypothetical protein